MIAVIETGGKQYLVQSGQTVSIEKVAGEEGGAITFDKVLLLADDEGKHVEVGTPYLSQRTVVGKIEKQMRDKKIRVVKFKAKVRYKRVHGHRQHKTTVTITS